MSTSPATSTYNFAYRPKGSTRPPRVNPFPTIVGKGRTHKRKTHKRRVHRRNTHKQSNRKRSNRKNKSQKRYRR